MEFGKLDPDDKESIAHLAREIKGEIAGWVKAAERGRETQYPLYSSLDQAHKKIIAVIERYTSTCSSHIIEKVREDVRKMFEWHISAKTNDNAFWRIQEDIDKLFAGIA